MERVREALRLAGVDHNSYSGHSFRAWAATTVAKNGVGDVTIKNWADGRAQRINCT